MTVFRLNLWLSLNQDLFNLFFFFFVSELKDSQQTSIKNITDIHQNIISKKLLFLNVLG